MTLDQTEAAYFEDPSATTLADLLRVARDYESDGRINDERFLDILAIVQDQLDALARMEKLA